MKIIDGITYHTIGEVAKEIERLVQTVKTWYKWYDEQTEAVKAQYYLPVSRRDLDAKGTNYFKQEDIAALVIFRDKVQYGMMADVNRSNWGARGQQIINEGPKTKGRKPNPATTEYIDKSEPTDASEQDTAIQQLQDIAATLELQNQLEGGKHIKEVVSPTPPVNDANPSAPCTIQIELLNVETKAGTEKGIQGRVLNFTDTFSFVNGLRIQLKSHGEFVVGAAVLSENNEVVFKSPTSSLKGILSKYVADKTITEDDAKDIKRQIIRLRKAHRATVNKI